MENLSDKLEPASVTRLRIGDLYTKYEWHEAQRAWKREMIPDDDHHYWAEVIRDATGFHYRVSGVTVEITEEEYKKVLANPHLYYFSTALRLHMRIRRTMEARAREPEILDLPFQTAPQGDDVRHRNEAAPPAQESVPQAELAADTIRPAPTQMEIDDRIITQAPLRASLALAMQVYARRLGRGDHAVADELRAQIQSALSRRVNFVDALAGVAQAIREDVKEMKAAGPN